MCRVTLARPGVTILLAIAAIVAPVKAKPAHAAVAIRGQTFICPVSGPITENLSGVTETSATDVWAVGSCFDGNAPQTLIEHWNGTTWTQIASPNPGGSVNRNQLLEVTALSPSRAWAAGFYNNSTADQTLIEQWNGTAWKQVTSPSPGGSDGSQLNGIAATSGSNAWAVGFYCADTACSMPQTLVLHWDGSTWTQMASPSPACPGGLSLNSVAVTSSTNAWAVGYCDASSGRQSLILHWDGTAWTEVPGPRNVCASSADLSSVAATSPFNAWAVGTCTGPDGSEGVLLRWASRAWRFWVGTGPDVFNGVATPSKPNVWVVGQVLGLTGGGRPDIESFNAGGGGTVPNPSPPDSPSVLLGVTFLSTSEGWAVGQQGAGGSAYTLTEHWDGTTWNLVASP